MEGRRVTDRHGPITYEQKNFLKWLYLSKNQAMVVYTSSVRDLLECGFLFIQVQVDECSFDQSIALVSLTPKGMLYASAI